MRFFKGPHDIRKLLTAALPAVWLLSAPTVFAADVVRRQRIDAPAGGRQQ